MLSGRRILLVIGGGIAAYKSLELIRLLKKAGAAVVPVLTGGGAEFVTPLTVSALAGERVHSALFDLTAEAEMGHIELSRERRSRRCRPGDGRPDGAPGATASPTISRARCSSPPTSACCSRRR